MRAFSASETGLPRELTLRHPRGSTAVVIGDGVLAGAGERLAGWLGSRRVYVVTTSRVRHLHGGLLEPLTRHSTGGAVFEVVEGEAAKTLGTAERLWEDLLAAGATRESRLIAFGGGSVCDLGGFVAACFLRGIEATLVPTTLLAQADAAIGGKTAVDLPAAKNCVGLFAHPHAVLADTAVLATLPRDELRAGLAEVVKVAFLLRPPLLDAVERDLDRLLAGDPEALAPVVADAAEIKAQLVERDPEEAGERRLLNFGHTLGHAIEAEAGFGGLRHGDAISYGMLFALRLARRHGLEAEPAERLVSLLDRFGLPPLPALDPRALLDRLRYDKKRRESGQVWVLPTAPGRGEMVEGIDAAVVEDELGGFLAAPLSPPSG